MARHLPVLTMRKEVEGSSKVELAPMSQRMGWWHTIGRRDFPLVTEGALRVLSCHATSAAAERLWSAMGRLDMPQRNALKISTAEKLCFIKANSSTCLGSHGRDEEVQLDWIEEDPLVQQNAEEDSDQTR